MRKIILFTWFIIILIIGASEAVCQCACNPRSPGYRYLTAHEALKTSGIVFTGKIVEVKKGEAPDD